MSHSVLVRLTGAGLVAAMACSSAIAASPAKVHVSTGVDYSRGNYGSDISTQILSVPVAAEVSKGNWRLRASVPWLRVSGDPNVLPTTGLVGPIGGILGSPTPTETAERKTASGVGDVTLEAKYRVPLRGKLGVELGINAKLATADADKGLGTGANDVGASIGLHREFKGTTVFGGVGHTLVGKNEALQLKDTSFGNLGVSRALGGATVGASYQHRTAATVDQVARRDMTGFVNLPSDGKRRVQVYASRGLSDSSPDWGVGMAVGVDLD